MTSKPEDVDRRRATSLVLHDATRRMLSPEEVRAIHEAVLSADETLHDRRGVAMGMLTKANSGRVLTYPEAQALAEAIEELWLDKPLSDGVDGGVRDTRFMCHKCTGCGGGGKSCPECLACQFGVQQVGGYVRNSLSRPPTYGIDLSKEDCGCKN